MRQTIQSIALGALLLVAAVPAAVSAELIMFEQAGCVWCMRWNSEIGPAYPNTAEGMIAPLRRVDIHEPIPEELADIRIERFTPTFVLVENGREIGRMRGYTGDEFFWFLLGEMLGRLDQPKAG